MTQYSMTLGCLHMLQISSSEKSRGLVRVGRDGAAAQGVHYKCIMYVHKQLCIYIYIYIYVHKHDNNNNNENDKHTTTTTTTNNNNNNNKNKNNDNNIIVTVILINSTALQKR